jgi:leader peptidase (prepilin peptidase)/N-methyltransferase
MMIYHEVPPVFLWLAIFVYGLALGSFTTCVIYRLPRHLPIFQLKGVQSRSFCPQCRHPLAARDLIPVLSWLWQKGRCRYCGKPIGARYVWVELAVLVGVFGIAGCFGFSIKTFLLALLLPVLAGIVAVFSHRRGL